MKSLRLLLVGILMLPIMAVSTSGAAANNAWDGEIDITFPVNNYQRYMDDYHHARGGVSGRHQATDIMTVYGERVYATVSGTIERAWGIDGNPPNWGYALDLRGDDGRMYRYIHLGRQNGPPSEAFASGLSQGDRVERGQHVGFAGHSGNASASAPHLHLEIHDSAVTDPYGYQRRNPFASLRAAEQRGDTPASRRAGTCSGKSYAFSGDWDRSGRDGLGWWCDGDVRLRTANGTIITYSYGRRGDVPLVADWNGDGRDTISIVRGGTWHIRESLSNGPANRTFTYGRVSDGDVPIAGDWNADGRDTIGIIRDGEWHLRHTQTGGHGQRVFTYGRITRGDLPLIGDWNGNGQDTIGIVREGEWHLRNDHSSGSAHNWYVYGRVLAGDIPVMGDWTGNGVATPAIVRNGDWHLRHVHRSGSADRTIMFTAP